jgi:hypothetical protein
MADKMNRADGRNAYKIVFRKLEEKRTLEKN